MGGISYLPLYRQGTMRHPWFNVLAKDVQLAEIISYTMPGVKLNPGLLEEPATYSTLHANFQQSLPFSHTARKKKEKKVVV